jgi:hypothetical protein
MTLARCVVPACPVRYASGPDRLCRDHGADDTSVNLTTRASGFGVTMTAFDGDQHDGGGDGGRPVATGQQTPAAPRYRTQ